MSRVITLDQVQAEADKRGYRLQATTEHLRAEKKQFTHVNRTFRLCPDFSLDQQYSKDYALLQVYYWVRGYSLSYGVDRSVALHRSMRHPTYDQRVRVAKTFDYHWDGEDDLSKLHQVMLQWVESVELVEPTGERSKHAH